MKPLLWAFPFFIALLAWIFLMESKESPLDTDEPTTSTQQQRVLGKLDVGSRKLVWSIPTAPDAPPKKELTDAIMDDDVCAVLQNQNLEDTDLVLSAFVHSLRSDDPLYPAVAALQDQVTEDSLASRFYGALRAAGLMESRLNKTNSRQALEALINLEKADSSNGAYALFASSVAVDLGASPKEQKDFLKRALTKPGFDTFITDSAQNIESLGQKSTSHFLVSQILLGRVNLEYGPMMMMLSRQIEKGDAEFNKSVLKFTQSILQTYPNNISAEKYFNTAEYQAVKTTYTRAYKKLYNKEANLPSFKDLMRNPASYDTTTANIMAALAPMQDTGNCDRRALDEVYYNWKHQW